MYAIRSYYVHQAQLDTGPHWQGRSVEAFTREREADDAVIHYAGFCGEPVERNDFRITSYNVCYTKLLRNLTKPFCPQQRYKKFNPGENVMFLLDLSHHARKAICATAVIMALAGPASVV